MNNPNSAGTPVEINSTSHDQNDTATAIDGNQGDTIKRGSDNGSTGQPAP